MADFDRSSYSVSVLTFPESLDNWDLVRSYFELRKKIFIEKMAWTLYQIDGVEFEQYDTMSDTVYIVAHCGRKAVGGARLRRTDCSTGNGNVSYSYMIRDAHLGILPQLPDNMCFEVPPVDTRVWELTRLVAVGDLSINRAILEKANDFLLAQAAERCLFLGPPAFMRMAKGMGWKPSPLGPVVGNEDGRFLAFQCDVRDRAAVG